MSIPSITGSRFFELSTVAGEGCSGAPLFMVTASQKLALMGVYVGERGAYHPTSADHGIELPVVGYATRNDALSAWRPDCLGGNNIEEEMGVLTGTRYSF